MANIVLDARIIKSEPAGVGRYARALIPELQRLGGDEHTFSIIRLVGSGEPLDIEGVEEVWEPRSSERIDHVLFGAIATYRHLERLDADLYHSLFHVLPIGLDLPIAMTMHDFIWIDHPELVGMSGITGKIERRAWLEVIRHGLERADSVIHVSDATRRRAKTLLGAAWDARQHAVVHHGVADHYFGEAPPLSERWRTVYERGPVVACVGNAKPYKNLRVVIEALGKMERDDVQLVLIGRCDGLEGHPTADVSKRLHMAGIADDRDLHALVAAADAFVFPSLVEGFGMPPLEAMAMGTPTLASARQPMIEVCSPGADTFAPTDSGELARRLDELFASTERMEGASVRARAHAKKFTWSDAAQKTLDVYAELLARS